MLDFPATLRISCKIAAEDAVSEFGKADVSIVGGDNISDYPYWNKSCALPKKNFEDLKAKLVETVSASTKDGKVLFAAGNNDMILGDIGTDENKPYNTTEFYYTGPMIDTLGELPESEKFEVKSIEKPWEYPYLNAYHYSVCGYDFIGINVDPNTSFNTHDGYYTDETLEWVRLKLNELDPHGIKPLFGHLSEQCYNTSGTLEAYCTFNREKFHQAFSGHKNLFYLYGHVHGFSYLHKDYSSGTVTHIKDGVAMGPNLASLSSLDLPDFDYSFVHMGGLRPFGTDFLDDGITGFGGLPEKQYYPCTGTPKYAQYLVMEVFDDRAVFHVRNAGTEEGFSRLDKLKPYVVYFRK